jgi:co-chaperonin GroES (HSP10)
MAESKGIGHVGYKPKLKGKLKPIRDNVLITDMNFEGRVSKGGIIILSDDGKTEGVRHRWGRVWAVGPEQKDVKVGEWILLEHGRWTRGITLDDPDTGEEITVRRADVKAILMVSDEKPGEEWETIGQHSKTQGQVFTPDMFGAR